MAATSRSIIASLPQIEHIRAAAAELVAQKPDVVVALTESEVIALQEETRTVPIVFVSASDPIGSGIVESLAKPSSNATGFISSEPTLGGKWLELLKQVAPNLANVAIILHPNDRGVADFRPSIEAAAQSLAVQLTIVPDDNSIAINRAIDAFAGQLNGGLVVSPSVYNLCPSRFDPGIGSET